MIYVAKSSSPVVAKKLVRALAELLGGIRIRGARVAYAVAPLAAAIMAGQATAATEYSWQIAGNGYWADNLLLADSGFKEVSSLAFEARPSIEIVQDSDRVKSRLNYNLALITYAADTEDDQALQNLDAGTEIAIVPDLFFVPAVVRYTQALFDQSGPGSYGAGLFGAGNLTNVLTYRVSPRLESKGSRGSFLLEASAGRVAYDQFNIENADDYGVTAIAGLGDPEGVLSWRFGYSTQETRYEGDQNYRFDSAFAEAGFRAIGDLRLLAQAGLESNIEGRPADGGLDARFWRAGAEWRASKSDFFEAYIGDRFFGTSYSARWVRTTKRLTLEASYSEDPTTQSRLISQQPFDPGARAIRADGLQAPRDFGRITNDAFLSRRFRSSVALNGRLTTIRLEARRESRNYFVDSSSDRSAELALTIERRLGPEFTVSVGANAGRFELREQSEYDEVQVGIRASRAFSDVLAGELEVSRVKRTGDPQGYSANWIRIGAVRKFGAN